MIETLGSDDCRNCRNFIAFHEELALAEARCAVLAEEWKGGGITAVVTPASFICRAAIRTGCNVEITQPRLQLTLQPED